MHRVDGFGGVAGLDRRILVDAQGQVHVIVERRDGNGGRVLLGCVGVVSHVPLLAPYWAAHFTPLSPF